jgi:regulator of Ty1 transposition protein 103
MTLAAEEEQLAHIASRRAEIDNKKKDVEDSIMRGFSSANSSPATPVGVGASPSSNQASVTPAAEPERPEVEALTPPGYPQISEADPVPELDLQSEDPSTTASAPVPNVPSSGPLSGLDILSTLSATYPKPSIGGSAKKRKLNSTDEFPDLGEDGLDADVAEMLRQDNGNGV